MEHVRCWVPPPQDAEQLDHEDQPPAVMAGQPEVDFVNCQFAAGQVAPVELVAPAVLVPPKHPTALSLTHHPQCTLLMLYPRQSWQVPYHVHGSMAVPHSPAVG